MNPCIKTGVNFTMESRPGVFFRGDLFRHPFGGWDISGVPYNTAGAIAVALPPASVMVPDIHIVAGEIVPRAARGPYADMRDVTILSASPEFRAFVAEWSPYALPHLP